MPASDKLLLRGLRLYGRHGVHAAETALGQQFVVDVDVKADLSRACASDDFNDALDYVTVFDVAHRAVQGTPRRLVERVAADIAEGVLKEISQAEEVKVRILKPHVALPAVLDGIGVEIVRTRERKDS